MQPTAQRGIYFLLLLILILVAVSTSFSVMQAMGMSVGAKSSTESNFFDSENANLVGTISAVKDNMITVQNKKGVKRTFKASQTLIIGSSNLDPKNPGNNDLKNLDLAKQYSINFIANSGELEVNSIIPYSSTPLAPIPVPVAPNVSGKTTPATGSGAVVTPTTPPLATPAPSAKP